ncbi:MAG: PEGA domain-containing protein [Candidatus Zixiibacteriota bacterium]|nr:MAG: PEGA domain-containing protein [candidate division Zixibacteria bacterium]
MVINKLMIFPLILISFCFTSAVAQDESNTIITTSPPGATVYLRGELDLVANTPASLPSNITGRYKAEITRPGYETWKGDLTFVPGSPNSVDIELSKKTRVKAMLRSLLIPGWGQIYSGDKLRGYLFTAGTIAAAATVFHLDRNLDKKLTDYDMARSDYNSATAIEDRIALKSYLDNKQRDAYNAETDRNTALAIGAALWGYNILDAILFFPESDAYFPSITSLGDGAALTFNIEF